VKPGYVTLPGAKTVLVGGDQPEYGTLPAVPLTDPEDGQQSVYTVWTLTDEERALIACGAHVEIHIKTFGNPVMPIAVGVAGRIDDGELYHESSILSCNDEAVEVTVIDAEAAGV